MAKKAGKLFVTAYLLLIFGIYPFYMREGYVDIGRAKYEFLIYCSLAALGILALIGVFVGGQALAKGLREHAPYFIDWDKVSMTDLLVLMYATEIFLSFAMSDYRQEALWGTEGWFMGTVLLLTLCGLYFFISRFWEGSRAVRYTALLASGGVFVLGILDRFSVYLIPLEIRQASFISTLGNINWFCGYFSVLFPVGVCSFLFGEEKGRENNRRWSVKVERGLYILYMIVGFMAGFCQGSSSIFLFYGALFYLSLWIAVENRKWLKDFFYLIFLWGVSAILVRGIGFLLPGGYNYDRDSLCARVTDSPLPFWAGIAAFGIYLFMEHREKAGYSGRTQDPDRGGGAGTRLLRAGRRGAPVGRRRVACRARPHRGPGCGDAAFSCLLFSRPPAEGGRCMGDARPCAGRAFTLPWRDACLRESVIQSRGRELAL